MDGIVVCQILSIGYENVNIEHFRLVAVGSIIAEENSKNNHEELSPVRLVAASKKLPPPPVSGDRCPG